jgi:hypothetical protein
MVTPEPQPDFIRAVLMGETVECRAVDRNGDAVATTEVGMEDVDTSGDLPVVVVSFDGDELPEFVDSVEWESERSSGVWIAGTGQGFIARRDLVVRQPYDLWGMV